MLTNVEEIKAKLDIVDIIQEYFPLKQAGVNFKANCPFHQEKTPSFMVSRERQMWHCFGCNQGGDMFAFLEKMENIDFPEALKILANKAGVALKYQDPKTTSLKTRILDMNEQAADWFAAQLTTAATGARAFKYLKESRELDDNIIKYWQLGYAPDQWDALGSYLRQAKFTKEEIIQSGLVVPKSGGYEYYDRFRDRIMFPIVDHHGSVVGFTGRTMKAEEQAKYVNTPQTVAYNKSEVIFGLYQAKPAIKEQDTVVIVEGNMDVIGSAKGGVKNVVAVSGTALTAEQIKILQRYTNNIIFSFDADSAGIRAAERAIELAWAAEANVKVVAIKKELAKDPDELARKNPATWQNLVATAIPAMDYFFALNLAAYQPDDINSKKGVAKNLLNLILKLANPVEQDFYLKKIATALDVNENALRETIYQTKRRVVAPSAPPATKNSLAPRPPADKKEAVALRLLAFMLLDRDYAVYISDIFSPDYLPTDHASLYKNLVAYYTKQLSATSLPAAPTDYLLSQAPDLTNLINSLIIKKEELRSLSYGEAVNELKQHIAFLKNIFIKDRRAAIKEEIKVLEQALTRSDSLSTTSEKTAQIQALLKQLDELSAGLQDPDF